MNFKIANYLILTLAGLLLSGCLNGQMSGLMSDGTRVVMNYEQGISSDVYTTTIGGEKFKGRAVSTDQVTAVGTAYSGSTSPYGTTIIGTSLGGKFEAVLLGDKGSSLRCSMQYADSTGFTSFGGVGVCRHSDGRTLDVQW